MKARLQLIAFYLAFVSFAIGAFIFNVACLSIAWLPDSRWRRRFVRHTASRLVRFWFRLIGSAGLFELDVGGVLATPDDTGRLLVANHPCLIDALLILSQKPDVTCVIKSAIKYNPFYGLIARCAGYISNDQGIDLVREAAARIRAGETVLIFPEGTRTAQRPVNPFQPGFALIACRARAPILPVIIDVNQRILAKGQPLFAMSHLPVSFRLRSFVPIEAAADVTPRQLAAEVETYFRVRIDAAPAFGAPAQADPAYQI